MLISSYDKELSYEWSTDGGYRELTDDPDLNFYTIKGSKLHTQETRNRASSAFNKKELSLPKTKLTKKENAPNNPGYTSKSYLPGDFNLSVTSKPYNFTKKWIDNLTDNFSLNASSILKERYDQIADDNTTKFSDIVGRHSNYFINTLRTKSAKDRCMTKASYEEYLPADFDAKGELEETLRSYANSRALDKTPTDFYRDTNSRQTFMSFYNDENNLLRSETDLNSSQIMDRPKSKKNHSKLSNQPIISARVLISSLNNKNNSEYFANHDPIEQAKNCSSVNSTNFEYKSEFRIENSQEKSNFEENHNYVLEEFGNSELEIQKKKAEIINKTVNEELIRKKLNAEIAIEEELRKLEMKNKNERNIYGKRFTSQRDKKEHDDLMERRKLLAKRDENTSKRLMSSLVVKIPVLQAPSTSRTDDISTLIPKSECETSSKITSYLRRTPVIQHQVSKKTEQNRPSTAVKKQQETLKNKQQVVLKNKPQSAPTRNNSTLNSETVDNLNNKKNTEDRRSSLFSMESKMTENENDLIFEQGSQSLSYFNNPSRISIIDKDTLYSSDLDQYMTYDNFEPITISITEIPHMDSTVKVRRYFDRETLRIKSMKLGSADRRNRIDSAKSNGTKLANSNLLKLKEENAVKTDSESKPNLCTNSMTTIVNDDDTTEIPGLTDTDKLNSEEQNSLSESRIKSAPGSNTAKLDLKLNERKVKSAMADVSSNKSVQKKIGGKSDSQKSKTRISSAPFSAKQGVRQGVRFFDMVDEKSLKSQCSDSTTYNDPNAVQSTISKIVLTEKNDKLSGDKDLNNINENGNIEQNKEFQLDYSIQDNEDETYVKEFTEALDPGESDKLKDKILEDLNYKSNQILEIRQVDAELQKDLAGFKKEFERNNSNQNKNTDTKSQKITNKSLYTVKDSEKKEFFSGNTKNISKGRTIAESTNTSEMIIETGQTKSLKETIKTDYNICHDSSENPKSVNINESNVIEESDILELQKAEEKKKELEEKNEQILTTVSEELLKSLLSYKPIKSPEIVLSRSSSISPNQVYFKSPSPVNDSNNKKEKVLMKQNSSSSSQRPASPFVAKSNKKVGFSDHVTSKLIKDIPKNLEKRPVVRTPEPPNNSILKKNDEVKIGEKSIKIGEAIKIINRQIAGEREEKNLEKTVTEEHVIENISKEEITIREIVNDETPIEVIQFANNLNEVLITQPIEENKAEINVQEILEEIVDYHAQIQESYNPATTDDLIESKGLDESTDDLHDQDYEDNTQVEKLYKELFPNITVLNPSAAEKQIAAGKYFHQIQDEYNLEEKKPTLYRNVNIPKTYLARYPHLEIPYDSKDPIVNQDQYNRAFKVPEVLFPRVYEINASKTSIDELLLERKILEEKINEVRENRVGKLINKVPDRTEPTKRASDAAALNTKESIQKEKEYNEERLRLQNETLKKQLEMESIEQLLISNINQKAKEIDSLTKELNKNTHEFEKRMKFIENRSAFLDNSLNELRDVIFNSRFDAREDLNQKFLERRRVQKKKQQEIRAEKYAEFDEKIRGIDHLIETEKLDEYQISEQEKEKYRIESDLQLWMVKFERSVQEGDKLLEEQETLEDNNFAIEQNIIDEETFRPITEEKAELTQEYQSLPVKYEQIKTKIISRIQEIIIEKEKIDLEKKSFDENMQKDLELRKAKLVELLQTEHEARMQIKRDLDQYRATILLKRENNLKMKCDLSMLKHSHGVSKSYELSFMVPLLPKEKKEGDGEKSKEETNPKKIKGKGKK